MSYSRPEHTDVMVIAEIQKLFTSKLGDVVRYDAIRNPKAVDDVGKN
jgi:hypothetical protein